jgi:Leucine-rich repeat (LRR) protein
MLAVAAGDQEVVQLLQEAAQHTFPGVNLRPPAVHGRAMPLTRPVSSPSSRAVSFLSPNFTVEATHRHMCTVKEELSVGCFTRDWRQDVLLTCLVYKGAQAGRQTVSCVSVELARVPAPFFACNSITQLDLSTNRLELLPAELGLLVSLTRLNLRCNLLCELPVQIGCLQALRYLDVSHNQLVELPPSMAMLRSLEELDLSANCISSVSSLECVAYLGVKKLLLLDNPLDKPLDSLLVEKTRLALPVTVTRSYFQSPSYSVLRDGDRKFSPLTLHCR